MACTVEQPTWSPHRLTGSPYIPRGLSPSRATSRLVVQSSLTDQTTNEPAGMSQRCISCGEDSYYVKPSRVDKVTHPASILKATATTCPSARRHTRHIGFKNEALVHHLGDLGEYLYTDFENVNFEPKPYNLYHRLARFSKLQRSALGDATNLQNGLGFTDDMAIKSKHASSQHHSNHLRSSSPPEKDAVISFSRNSSGALSMHLSVFVGKEHNPKDVLVKACTSGKKLRVIAGANQDKASHTIPSFIRDISLPMEIESVSIRAKIDPKGYLAIEGNVKDMSKKMGS